MADANDSVEWRTIPSCPPYEASPDGHIRRKAFRRPAGRGFYDAPPRIMSPSGWGDGYFRVHLHFDGKSHMKYVARLVAETFIPRPHDKTEVNHVDGDKRNNSVANLEWVTPSENVKHKVGILGKGRGEKAPGRRHLTEQDIIAIRADRGTNREIAKRYAISEGHVSQIRHRKTWAHVGGQSGINRRSASKSTLRALAFVRL